MAEQNRNRVTRPVAAAKKDDTNYHNELLRKIAELEEANAQIKKSRKAALHLMEEAIQSREALRQSEEKMRRMTAMVNQSSEPIISWKLHEGIIEWNAGAELLYGYSYNEVNGNIIHDVLHTKFPVPFSQFIEHLKSNKEWTGELIHRTKDNDQVIVESRMKLVEVDGHQLVFETNRNITERKKLEQQKEDFIGIASHELKTPVTSIKAYTELLQEMFRQEDFRAAGPFIDKLDVQVDRLIELIHDLLDITQMVEGELLLRLEQFSLKTLVEESVEELRRLSSVHKIIIQAKEEVIIIADAERIRQVLVNFISNAIKYSPKGGDVIINWRETKEGVEVSIKDDGIGISAELHSKIFDRFFRVSDPVIKTFPGMGLGLYINANIIRRHKGRLWLESKPGKGSVFYFTIPLTNKPGL